MTLENLSDGKSDGFALFYLKDGKLNSVMLTEDQVTALDLMLKVVFGEEKATIVNCDESVIRNMI